MARNLEFKCRPPLWKAYPRFLLGSRPGHRRGQEFPHLQAHWNEVRVQQDLLRRYRRCCEIEDEPGLPFHYPHVLVSPMHLIMLTEKEFPFRLLGAVHLRNHAIRYRFIEPDETLNFKAELKECRFRPQGYEFDLDTRVTSAGKTVWAERTTFLVRKKLQDEDPASPLVRAFPRSQEPPANSWDFTVPAQAGKRYAAITGDYNPIHVSRVMARVFGFRRDLVHGMWGVARATHQLALLRKPAPVRIDVSFKGPLFMQHRIRVEERPGPQDISLRLFCGEETRPAMLIAVRETTPEARPEAFEA